MRVEELQRGVSDVLVQLGPIHARSIVAGFGIVIPSHLVALIAENLMANGTGQHVEPGMRDIVRGKLGIFLRRRCRVSGTDNDVSRNLHLPKRSLVHAKPLNVAGSHRKCCLHPIIAHVTRGFGVKEHLRTQIRRHNLVVFPSALECQKQVGINLGPTDPQGGKSPLRMPRYANLIWVDVRSPNLVLKEMSDVQADVTRFAARACCVRTVRSNQTYWHDSGTDQPPLSGPGRMLV